VLIAACVGLNAGYADACNIVNGKMYGDCTGVTVSTQAHPKITARGFQEIDGIYAGADVPSGATLVVDGIIENTTRVFKNGHLVVNGSVNDVQCDGGKVKIDGQAGPIRMNSCSITVSGIIGSVEGTGTRHYLPGAVIGGVPYVDGLYRVDE
jgi:hypothetical protein